MNTKDIKELEYRITGLAVHIADRGRILKELLYKENRVVTMFLDESNLDELEEMIRKYRKTLEEYNEAKRKREEAVTKPKGDKWGRFAVDE